MMARGLPLGAFGAPMGLIGLGLAARAAAPLFPGVFRAPAYFSEPWIAAGVLALVGLALLYAFKVVAHPAEVKADLTEPERLGAAGLVAIGLTLAAAGLLPYAPGAAAVLWWVSVVLYLAGFCWGLWTLWRIRAALHRVTPAWIVLLVGGIVMPAAGVPLGLEKWSGALYLLGLAGLLFLLLPLWRRARQAPLPVPLRPSWFILLAPPVLIHSHGLLLYRDPAFEVALYAGVAVLAALLAWARDILRWPFSAPLWSITFPLDAFALSATRQALATQAPGWRAVAALAILLATLAVVFVILRMSMAFARRSAHARVQ